MPAERIDISSGDAYQRARRRLYAERNAATLARLNRRAARDRELEEILETAEQSVINVFDPRESENLDHHHQQDNHQHQQDKHHHEAGNVGGQGGVDDDDAEWVTLEEDQPDEVDLAIASEKARRQQQAKEVNWKTLTALLHPIYMKLRNATQNWTASNSYDTFTVCPETCLRKKNRQVDLIDVHRQRRSIIQFCECTKDGVRLLQHGYLAGSPVKPVTAFSLPLLILHNCLWNNCNVNALPFTNALTQWLEPRSQRLRTKGGKHARQLRKPFTAVVDLFRLLEDMTTEVVHSILKLTNQQILAWTSCPACFGPSSLNSTQYSGLMKNRLELCLDGNFQHRHQSKAGRNYQRIRTPRIFLKQSFVNRVSQEIVQAETQDMTPEQTDRCTDAHKAANDKRNESTWKGCDDTGLMGCCCRHDTVVHLANIFKSGEQRQFPMALIKRVLADIEPNRPVGFLYDIGCSMDKYINIRRLIPQDRPRIKFATLVFHAYAHNWACQLDYHPRFNESWGLSDGEGLERLWSYLSPLVSPLRYATRNHRLAAIAHRTKHHNERSIVQLAYWMRRKFTRALKRRQEWEAQRQFSQEHATGEDDRRKRLVALYKRQETLDILRASLQDESIFLLSPDRARAVVAAIVDAATFIQTETVELTRSGDLDVTDPEEQKVRLLVWDAKSALYAEAVYLQAESQPLRDPHLMGSHLGTHGKEKVTRAINARDASGKLLVEAFNREYQIFKDNYTDARFTHSHIHPLTYKEFKKFPLDHHFWNDELYYHSTAPWSIDPDVREGINGVLLLQRIKEEFELIAQEVACSMGWAIALHHDICTIITQARSSINLLNNNGTPDLTFIDYVQLGDFSPVEKLRVIGEELQTRLLAHQTLVEEWSPDIEWLWNRCQPLENRGRISEWHALMTEVQRHIPQEFPAPAEVEGAVEGIDDALEAAVVDVGNNDGEDGWISDEGEGNVNNNNDNLDDDKDDVDTNELVQNDPNTQ
ncbi:hypothetical protein Pst134EA_013399 [Puccinia striiformis f. sp. tritici]|uniref:hypothetical protein n=1 Tax=Puccinia striiformis f. sp. tritici TaxID=168172 RepID=UPI0020076F8C|nr:hypothetical protein Pst134EA_013399 [Puccinia striiformis f. sp. tritici]KAH9465517.1 hypothetical protein Pst134EA_013399 [Puccinia striiformis f. sp. tritici]